MIKYKYEDQFFIFFNLQLILNHFQTFTQTLFQNNQAKDIRFIIIQSFLMKNLNQEDTHYHEVQGTIIIPVNPKGSNELMTPPKKTRKKYPPKAKLKYEGQYKQAQQSSFNDQPKQNQHNSDGKMRGPDEQTMVELQDNGFIQPYQFLSQRSPSIVSIFFPRKTVKSITFWLSITYILMFIILLGYNYSRTQTDLSWNCSLYKLQSKYFPKLRFEMQFQRVIMSALLHSNLAHFFLDLFALQVYGYFVEWYFGHARFGVVAIVAAVYSHFLSCQAQKTSISTTPSAVLFAILTLKAVFLWEYRQYKKLFERRNFLYLLLILIVGINLIPIFVVNNIDYSAHLGGVIVGLCMGVYFLAAKEEEQTLKTKALRVSVIAFLIITFGLYVGLVFSDSSQQYELLSSSIGPRCDSN